MLICSVYSQGDLTSQLRSFSKSTTVTSGHGIILMLSTNVGIKFPPYGKDTGSDCGHTNFKQHIGHNSVQL
ncbi:hypothetical protein L798_15412 [Zootermopsis nevadensis]|uniref:Uncharacterized protein n=1 Tax=Zootermopsis nevadensis TaxID=136037 RepID=A0A067QLX3_ZOONE|nr:hypothetical protein L798_15412 [Zootermopsis nevadensis]